MLMKKITIPKFNIGEEYGLHEFDLIPLREVIADNNLAYYIYRYRRIKKIKIYLFYNCDILSAFCVLDINKEVLKIITKGSLKKQMILKILTNFQE